MIPTPQPDSPCPSPDTAYAEAPSIVQEISWVASSAADWNSTVPTDREFWLRKAALLDRIALDEIERFAPGVAAAAVGAAEDAAGRLADHDHTHYTTRGPIGPLLNPPDRSYRPYVRQEYLAWSKTQTDS